MVVKIPVLGLPTILRYDIKNRVVIILRSSYGATIKQSFKTSLGTFCGPNGGQIENEQ